MWINHVLKKHIFRDLESRIHNGYVYINRKGLDVMDKITKKLVPNLKYYHWQQNRPIDYETLKHVVTQNPFQRNVNSNDEQRIEAEEILSQENIIALQPNPIYQIWTLKRLIMCWYGDITLEENIRKIKVLINQYRADPRHKFNQQNGILPQILIYPKYGKDSVRIVLSKLIYYFSLYVDESPSLRYNNIQWKYSNPLYFLKKNEFIYYTNGSLDIKNYIKQSFKNGNQFNETYDPHYTEMKVSNGILSV
tara:strand:- start:23 stop:772 length:750 start_codon:yes stop_codon:yes gene_type:complete